MSFAKPILPSLAMWMFAMPRVDSPWGHLLVKQPSIRSPILIGPASMQLQPIAKRVCDGLRRAKSATAVGIVTVA